MFLSYRNSSCLGLDIGSSGIKAVQLRKSRREVYLCRYGLAKTPAGAVSDGKIQKPEQLAGSLKALMNRKIFRGKACVISVGRDNVILRSLFLPQMKQKELYEAMSYEAQKHIALEKVAYDYTRLPCADQGQMKILIAAVPWEIIQKYIEVMDLAGLYVSAVEVEPLALIRNFGFDLKDRRPLENEEIFILLDVGVETTGMNVLEGSCYSFSRNLAFGSNSIIGRVMEEEKISRELAEYKLNNYSLKSLKGAEDAASQLVREVQRNLSSYLYKNDDRELQLKNILITGGAAGFTGLDSYIGSELGIETYILDPFLHLKWDKKVSSNIASNIARDKRFLNVAIGLALRRWRRDVH